MSMSRRRAKTSATYMPGCRRSWIETQLPANMVINVRGTVQAMRSSFQSFGLGLILSTVLVYLILVAQFKSFIDPFLILLAVPTGLAGVLLILFATGTTMNIMSLMGVVMMCPACPARCTLGARMYHEQRLV